MLDDCGECGGDAVVDDCGICNGDGTWCLSATISLGAASDSSLEVLYSSPLDMGGFQFDVSGVEISGASGGAAEDAGFDVSTGGSTVLGFSFSGDVIPAGSGVLTNLDITVVDAEACLSDVVVSDGIGSELEFEAGGCIELPFSCDDADADGICDDVDDCVGEVDECGVCNGQGIGEDACDCDGNVVDDCGVCGGDGTSCLDNILSLGAATESSLEVLYSSSSDIAGFQFAVSGVNLLGASGGDPEGSGLTVSVGAVVLGYSVDGSSIPAGEGVLTNLEIEVTDAEACISDIVVADPDANPVDFAAGGCVELPFEPPCDDADADGICDDVDDCVGEYDDCGICNGDGTWCLSATISLGAATDSLSLIHI